MDNEFLKKWVAILDAMDPNARAKANALSIKVLGQFFAVDQAGNVSVGQVERDPVKKPYDGPEPGGGRFA